MTVSAKDSVKVQWTGTGTGAMTLGAAVSGYQSFPAALDGKQVSYLIEHQGDGVFERENGRGTYTASTGTLSRDEVTFSTNSDALVDFSAGTKHVTVVILASDLELFIGEGTADFIFGRNSEGEPVEIDPNELPGASLPTPTVAIIGAANNPYALDADNRSDGDIAKSIVVDDDPEIVVLELQSGVSPRATWEIFRSKDHTGRIIGTAASGVSIDGVAGVGATSQRNVSWTLGSPAGRTGTITSDASPGDLPTFNEGDLFEIANIMGSPAASDNAGLYVVTSSTVDALGFEKVSGNDPVEAAGQTADIIVRGIGFELAQGRATGPLVLVQSNDARFEGEGVSDIIIPRNVVFQGSASGHGRKNGTRSDAGTALSAADSGGFFDTGGALTFPNSAIGDGWFHCDFEVGADTHDWTFNGTTLDISAAGVQAGERYNFTAFSASTCRITGPNNFDETDFS